MRKRRERKAFRAENVSGGCRVKYKGTFRNGKTAVMFMTGSVY